MSGSEPNDSTPRTPTPELRLRADRPRVTRLSRKVIIGAGAVAVTGVLGLGYVALQSRNGNRQPQELYNTQSRNIADGIANLPSGYTEIPKPAPPLGPPLPGDLGPPILHAQQQGQISSGNDEAQQRLAQEQQAALTSSLFVQTQTQPAEAAAAEIAQAPAPAGKSSPSPSGDPTAMENMQDQKLAFMNGPSDVQTVSLDRLQGPASPYVLQAGSVIPAALITGLESDLPGQITAQVTENVYDSPTGKYLLIPQGARLEGEYDSSVSFGQSRILLVWTRLIMPDGQSIVLQRQEGADAQGYSGLEDGVDYHWWGIAKAAVLSTVLGIGSELGANNNDNDIVLALREGTADTLNQAGQQIVERQLNIQPTLTDRNGLPVDVIVDRDLVLAPYEQGVSP
ncbi:TrbI/VirB10 family protein [Acidocella facilis]|uniref:TrbI/VirB10 family protein n=1 Tax=Acidocella facilis TaxID=525 RepID=UPI001F4291AA|nr:TrbI/VirB10 family protein [Acidocella facilis]